MKLRQDKRHGYCGIVASVTNKYSQGEVLSHSGEMRSEASDLHLPDHDIRRIV